MHNETYAKKTEWKLFGKYSILTKDVIFSGVEFDGQIYQINMTPEYYNLEFKLNGEQKDKDS